jgi:hypothetical protein
MGLDLHMGYCYPDRQLALLKISIEAGILLCGNGFHAMMVARTRRS